MAAADVVVAAVVVVMAAPPPNVLADSVADVSEVRVSLELQPEDHCSLCYCYYCYCCLCCRYCCCRRPSRAGLPAGEHWPGRPCSLS